MFFRHHSTLKFLQDNFDTIKFCHFANTDMALGSTTPLELLTPFILIFVTNLIKRGGASGYLGTHSSLSLYIRFS